MTRKIWNLKYGARKSRLSVQRISVSVVAKRPTGASWLWSTNRANYNKWFIKLHTHNQTTHKCIMALVHRLFTKTFFPNSIILLRRLWFGRCRLTAARQGHNALSKIGTNDIARQPIQDCSFVSNRNVEQGRSRTKASNGPTDAKHQSSNNELPINGCIGGNMKLVTTDKWFRQAFWLVGTKGIVCKTLIGK